MKRGETTQETALRKKREQKELAKRQRELAKIKPGGYLIYMLTILSIVYIIDEIASNISSSLQSEMITEFFVNAKGLEYNTGLATYTAMTAPLYAFMLLTPFYKSLADRFGRKVFLMLNTIGMGLGMFVCMIATGPVGYIVGYAIIYFLMGNDIQVLYVMECAPEKHRAKFTSITKAIALLGVTVIPILRNVFMGNNGGQWQKVFLIPAIAGVIVGLASFFLMPETPAYLKRRITYLQMSDEERNAGNTDDKKANDENGGVVSALKFIFSHRQTRAVLLCAFIFITSTGVTSYYESIMKTGGMSTAQITTAMYYIPFVNAFMTGMSGFITDYLGRKRSAVVLTLIALVGLVSFVFCAGNAAAPALVGICYGLFIGGLWSACDILFIIIPGESVPTHLRVSVVGTMGLISGVDSVLSLVMMTVGMLLVESIGTLSLCVCVPFLFLAIVILILRVNETQGTDLTTVTGSEWD